MSLLKDRVALVTGGGSGIGRAVSKRFAEEGAAVAVNDINKEAAEKTVAELGSGIAVPADVADAGQIRTMFEEIDRQLGPVDVLVNCAGIAESKPGEGEEMETLITARMTEGMSG